MNAKKLVLIVFIAGMVIALPFINRAVFGTNVKEVNVSTLTQRVISPSILASGFLAHEEEVMLSSEVIGKVAELFVEEGDVVRQGNLVLRVDDKNFIAG
ncbi:MAG: biotin/lipoyl-binding protein, partial [Gammaproteobacteria bacterium]|nr:biotin/lipoyl-binding protein [Gammaproteobacteria bacterium]